jgi:sulfide:quinone oxidoreductase
MLLVARKAVVPTSSLPRSCLRRASTAADKNSYKIVVVGAGKLILVYFLCFLYIFLSAGSGGLTVANQIYHRFRAAGKPLNIGDIAVVDPALYHYYQPGWSEFGSQFYS